MFGHAIGLVLVYTRRERTQQKRRKTCALRYLGSEI